MRRVGQGNAGGQSAAAPLELVAGHPDFFREVLHQLVSPPLARRWCLAAPIPGLLLRREASERHGGLSPREDGLLLDVRLEELLATKNVTEVGDGDLRQDFSLGPE